MKVSHVFSIGQSTYKAELTIDKHRKEIIDVSNLRTWRDSTEEWQSVNDFREFEKIRNLLLAENDIYHFS